MKKLYFLFIISSVYLSCQKNPDPDAETLINENEIPGWLKIQIHKNELLLQQSNDYVVSTSAWVRYKWNDEFYFENSIMTSSSFAYPISFKGDTLKVCPVCIGTDYHDQKCCKQFVWKGANYIN